MAMLEQHPPHVRRKIAFFLTIGIAAMLLVILILKTTSKNAKKGEESGSLFRAFYETIMEGVQSTPTRK